MEPLELLLRVLSTFDLLSGSMFLFGRRNEVFFVIENLFFSKGVSFFNRVPFCRFVFFFFFLDALVFFLFSLALHWKKKKKRKIQK